MSGLHSSPRLSKQSFEVQQRLRSEDVTNLDLSKVLETIVIDQFLDYLDEYNILPPAQHGFRKSHSTVTALVKTIQKWTSQKGSAIASFDYSAAFDTISKDDDDVMMYQYVFPTHLKFEHVYLTEVCPAWDRRTKDSHYNLRGKTRHVE